jgi:hypothetical protein
MADHKGLEFFVSELGRKDLIYFKPFVFPADRVASVDPKAGLIEEGP